MAATWRRADRPSVSSWAALVFFGIGVVFTTVVTVLLFSADVRWEVSAALGTLVIYGFLTIWTGFAWRMHRTGIYVSDEAVRVIYPWRTRVFAWSDVAEVSSGPAMFGGWQTVRDAIFLGLKDGRRVETPVQRRANWSAVGVRKNVGPVLNPADFDATLAVLRSVQGRVKV